MSRHFPLTLAVVVLTAVAVTGCGGGDSDIGSLKPPAQLSDTGPDVKIVATDFTKWSDASAGGFKCEHPRLVFGDTGKAIDHADQAAKIKSKVPATFQCIDAGHKFWALPRKNRKDAELHSNAGKIASGFRLLIFLVPITATQ